MSYELEVERKFLMEGFPTELECLREVHIEQGYLSIEPEVRIHTARDLHTQAVNYRLTIKGDGELARAEMKTAIDEEFYREALKLMGKEMIAKEYKAYRLGAYILEVCQVEPGTEREFFYGEVEFPSVEEAEAFRPIACLGQEVTRDASYKMKNYWKRTRG